MTFRETLARFLSPSSFRGPPTADPAPATPQEEPPKPSPFDNLPRRVPARQSARDLPISAMSEWNTVTAIRGALTDLDRGLFAAPALMLDAMLGDSHIAAKLDDRLSGLLGAPFDMTPPPGLEEDDRALGVAEDGRAMWSSIGADKGDRMVMRDGIMLGAGLGEVVVEPGEKEWRIRLKHWHARNLWWNWATRSYWINTVGGSEEIRPDGRGGYFSIWRGADGEHVTRWMLYTPYGYQRGWVNARAKALAIPWLLRMWSFRDWGRHSELLGIPPRKVKVPSEWDDGEKKRALQEVAKMASEGIALCPQKPDGYGFDIELLELKGPNGWEAFERLIGRAEAAITVALVGQTLTTQVDDKGANRALGEVHERVEAKIRKSDAEAFGGSARSAIVLPWTEFNVGSIELAPVPTWAVDPPEDLKKLGDGLKAVGDGLTSLHGAGVPVDRAKICAEAGIPVEEGAEFRDIEDDQEQEGSATAGKGSGLRAVAAARQAARLTREVLASGRLGRRQRAPLQGQAYVDELAEAGRTAAARILAGDVRALREVVANAKADANGRIDATSLRAELLRAYGEMKPTELAAALGKVVLLAELSGRYAVVKEVVSE